MPEVFSTLMGGPVRRMRQAALALFQAPRLIRAEERLRQAEADRRDAETRLEAYRQELKKIQAVLGDAEADRSRHQALRDRLDPVAGLALPVYVTADLQISAQPWANPHRNRVCICSIPKSGTYLVAELLRLLGYVPTWLHLWTTGLSDYRTASLREARDEYHRFTAPLHLSRSLGLVLPGQFAVGHLEHTEEVRTYLGPFKTIFTCRDLRDAVVSHMRFLGATTRSGRESRDWKALPEGPEKMLPYLDTADGAAFFQLSRAMLGWATDPSAFKIRFETLYGDRGQEALSRLIEALHRFLEIPDRLTHPGELIHELIGSPSITWSGRRTRRSFSWDEVVEERFRSLGGYEFNAALGPEAPEVD
jgi:hypothetical protein